MYNIKCEEKPATPHKTERPVPDIDKKTKTHTKEVSPNPHKDNKSK